MEKRKVVVVGSGPAALAFAAFLDGELFDVHIYEKNTAPGRKFLVAGDGGFNLTHSEELDSFVTRYTPQHFIEPFIRSFSNEDLRRWLNSIGILTYVGTSKRIFPAKGIKPIEVLEAIVKLLKEKNVRFHFGEEWMGWKNEMLQFSNEKDVSADIIVFALGGSSWKVTGSDGAWAKYFAGKNISIVPFQPSNCAVKIEWSKEFLATNEGKPLKNISIRFGSNEKKGEVVITSFGLEGNAVYFHSPEIRRQIAEHNTATIEIDLCPDISSVEIQRKLTSVKERNRSAQLKSALGFDKTKIALVSSQLNKEQFLSDEYISRCAKKVQLKITGLAPIDEAISTVGGIALNEVDETLQLRKLPDHYVIGEMLDWDAPTGGYLLQGCFSMGVALAKKLNAPKGN